MKIASRIYQFVEYREFLRDRYSQLKETDPAFSFRNFSKQAGFGSPNYLKLVMDGKRNLSEEAIDKFAKGIRLDEHETEYFRFMVLANQCSEVQRKNIYEAKMLYLKELFNVKDMIPELYDYYHGWYHAAIRETIKKSPVRKDLKRISSSLVPPISEEEAHQSIELLKKLEMIEETHDGTLKALECSEAEKAVQTSEKAQKIYHEQMAELAAQSIYMQDSTDQDYESLTVSLSPDQIKELQGKIGSLVQEIAKTPETDEQTPVYQLNIQLFALTRVQKEEDTQEVKA